jgi:hypothetical protein
MDLYVQSNFAKIIFPHLERLGTYQECIADPIHPLLESVRLVKTESKPGESRGRKVMGLSPHERG